MSCSQRAVCRSIRSSRVLRAPNVRTSDVIPHTRPPCLTTERCYKHDHTLHRMSQKYSKIIGSYCRWVLWPLLMPAPLTAFHYSSYTCILFLGCTIQHVVGFSFCISFPPLLTSIICILLLIFVAFSSFKTFINSLIQFHFHISTTQEYGFTR